MEKFTPFFKEGENREKLQEVINDAVENETNTLYNSNGFNFKAEREDQEFNNVYMANFFGKNIDSINPEMIEEFESYLVERNAYVNEKIEEIQDYIETHSGTKDLEEYQEKLNDLNKINEAIRSLQHTMANEFAHAEVLNKEQAFLYGENMYFYDQELSKLEIEKDILEKSIKKDSPQITQEEKNRLLEKIEELTEENNTQQKYLHGDSSLN